MRADERVADVDALARADAVAVIGAVRALALDQDVGAVSVLEVDRGFDRRPVLFGDPAPFASRFAYAVLVEVDDPGETAAVAVVFAIARGTHQSFHNVLRV